MRYAHHPPHHSDVRCGVAESKGNAKTQKRDGRPPLYVTPEELAEAVSAYFLLPKRTEANPFPDPPTLAGLAYFLGFCDRQSLTDQEERGEEFSCIIKRAKLLIQAAHEGGLYGTSCTGHIFWLKNHAGYVDKQEMEHSGSETFLEALKAAHSGA